MTRTHALFACSLASAAILVSGCAIFQANPTASTCASSANAVTAAQTSLALAEAVVAAIQAGQANPSKTLTQAQADVTAAQSVLTVVTSAYAAKCAAPAPAAS